MSRINLTWRALPGGYAFPQCNWAAWTKKASHSFLTYAGWNFPFAKNTQRRICVIGLEGKKRFKHGGVQMEGEDMGVLDSQIVIMPPEKARFYNSIATGGKLECLLEKISRTGLNVSHSRHIKDRKAASTSVRSRNRRTSLVW